MDRRDALAALNRLCVRLVFCLYAEDAGVFPKDCFRRLVEASDERRLRRDLMALFRVLDTPPERRDPYLEPELAAFPYTNGGLFRVGGGVLSTDYTDCHGSGGEEDSAAKNAKSAKGGEGSGENGRIISPERSEHCEAMSLEGRDAPLPQDFASSATFAAKNTSPSPLSLYTSTFLHG